MKKYIFVILAIVAYLRMISNLPAYVNIGMLMLRFTIL